MSKKVVLGRFGGSHGVHGWIKVISATEPPDNIVNYQQWLVKGAEGWAPIAIQGSKVQSGKVIVHIAGCDTPEQARQYTHKEIAVERAELAELEKGEFYWTDLEELTVVNTQGVVLGTVKRLMATGANDVLVVQGEKEQLIPFIKHVIVSVDLVDKRIVVDWDENF